LTKDPAAPRLSGDDSPVADRNGSSSPPRRRWWILTEVRLAARGDLGDIAIESSNAPRARFRGEFLEGLDCRVLRYTRGCGARTRGGPLAPDLPSRNGPARLGDQERGAALRTRTRSGRSAGGVAPTPRWVALGRLGRHEGRAHAIRDVLHILENETLRTPSSVSRASSQTMLTPESFGPILCVRGLSCGPRVFPATSAAWPLEPGRATAQRPFPLRNLQTPAAKGCFHALRW